MSRWSSVCDAVLADLQDHVANLSAANAVPHKYAAWDPQHLRADGSRHVAVYPGGQQATGLLMPVTTQIDVLVHVLVWEDQAHEYERRFADEAAAAAFYDLHDQVEARFELIANIALGGAWYVEYLSTDLPDTALPVRYFDIQLRAKTGAAFT